MKRIIVATALTLLSSLSGIAANTPIRVTLSLPEEKTLPGLAVPLLLHIENGSSAVKLAPGVQVRATSTSGESFIVDWRVRMYGGELEFGLTDEDDESHELKLPANATIDLSVAAVDFDQPSWAHDERLMSRPGQWKLEALLFEKGKHSEPIAVSSPANLTIETPSAGDTAILQLMRQYGVSGTAEKVLLEHPDSKYFPYFAAFVPRRSVEERIEIIRRAMALHPNTPVLPWLRYMLALSYGTQANDVFAGGDGDFEKAVAIAEKGRTELAKLRDSNDPWSRLKGNQQLENFPSREGYEDRLRSACEDNNRKPKNCQGH